MRPAAIEARFPSERRLLEHEPIIALGGAALYGSNLGEIQEIEFGKGKIVVDDANSPFTNAEFPMVVLATLGFTAKDTAYLTNKAESTVATQLKAAMQGIREDSSAQIRTKTGLARYCFMNQIYYRDEPGARLYLSPSEARVVKHLSYGENSKSIGTSLGLSSSTVDAHVKNVSKRSGLHGREQVVLAAFLSGEISI